MKRTIAILIAIMLCVTLCGSACADDNWTVFREIKSRGIHIYAVKKGSVNGHLTIDLAEHFR